MNLKLLYYMIKQISFVEWKYNQMFLFFLTINIQVTTFLNSSNMHTQKKKPGLPLSEISYPAGPS